MLIWFLAQRRERARRHAGRRLMPVPTRLTFAISSSTVVIAGADVGQNALRSVSPSRAPDRHRGT